MERTPANTLWARVHWLRLERDHQLAALQETYMPRLKALHDEWTERREQVWQRYRSEAAKLRDAA